MKLHFDGLLVLAGAGKMGTALLEGWLARGVPASSIVIQDPALGQTVAELAQRHRIRVCAEITHLDAVPLVIVAAVKPQLMDEVFPPLARHSGPETVVLSIAAGRSIASFEKSLPAGRAVVRAMPNTPAAIGRGITAAIGNVHVTQRQKETCNDLLSAIGEVVWLDSESSIDTVTAVSGSGPAYVFLLAECLAEAGAAAGLDRITAQKLARATVSGAGDLLRQSDSEASKLRQDVTSSGGTTAAALAVLMRDKGGLQQLLTEAVMAAKARSQELGK